MVSGDSYMHTFGYSYLNIYTGGGYSQQHTYLDGGHRRGGLPCGGGTADFL